MFSILICFSYDVSELFTSARAEDVLFLLMSSTRLRVKPNFLACSQRVVSSRARQFSRAFARSANHTEIRDYPRD